MECIKKRDQLNMMSFVLVWFGHMRAISDCEDDLTQYFAIEDHLLIVDSQNSNRR